MSSPDRIDVSLARPGATGLYRLNETGRILDASDDLLQIFAVESIKDLQLIGGSSEHTPTQIVPWHSPQSTSGQMFADYFSRHLPISQCQTDIEIAGQRRTIVETLVPVRNSAGHLEQWLGTVHDFTATQSQNAAAIELAHDRADSKESQIGELCDQVRWALGRIRESIRAGDSPCMTNALCDTIEHLVNLESECNLDGEVSADLELQTLKDRRQGFRLCELVEDLAESAASEIHRAGRRITVQIGHDLPAVVRGNLQTIHCVLANLLHHAASHSEWGDVKLIASKNGKRTTFAIQVARHSFASNGANALSPEMYPSEWRIASRYAQRLHSDLKPRILPSGCLEVAFDTTLVEDTDLRSSQHPELVLGENTRVLIVTAHTATRDALTEILAGWRIASSTCDELDVALQRIRINQKMGRNFDAILIDESIFATRQTLSKETLECLATSANIRIQSRGTTCQSNFHHRLRAPDWVWTVSEPIRQSCLRTALIGATKTGEPDESDSCLQCHSGSLHAHADIDPVVVSQIDLPANVVSRVAVDREATTEPKSIESSLLMSVEGLQKECGGDKALSAVVMEVMCSSMPMRLHEMQTAADRGDLETVTRLAHQMSGAAKDHSMTAVAELTSQLTAHAISKNNEGVRTCLSALSNRVEQTIDFMQSLLEETL
ncbi:Hpt domain-containing protein [Rhodopirellula baltica]